MALEPKKGLRVDVDTRTFVLLDAVVDAPEPQWYGADIGTYPHSVGVHALKVSDMRVRQARPGGEASLPIDEATEGDIPTPKTEPDAHA